jgi:hypothetical protein
VKPLHSRALAAVAVLATALLSCACGAQSLTGPGSSTPRPSSDGQVDPERWTPVLDLSFDAASLDGGRLSVPNKGRLDVDIDVQDANGGAVRLVRGPGAGSSLRFPALSAASSPTRAILTVLPDEGAGNTDSLNPRGLAFTFGAEFELDPISEGSAEDDGNNLLQRGLGVDPAQYKLQVDHGLVSCRVAGDEGELVVRSQTPVQPGQWYDASCTRRGNHVSLRVQQRGSKDADADVTRGTGPTGSVSSPPTVPLSVGGKAAYDGSAVVHNSDQFNGVVHSVFLAVGDED